MQYSYQWTLSMIDDPEFLDSRIMSSLSKQIEGKVSPNRVNGRQWYTLHSQKETGEVLPVRSTREKEPKVKYGYFG